MKVEARVDDLEKDMSEVRADIKAIRSDMIAIRTDVAEIKGRLSAMPTTWQMVGLVFAIMAGSFAILRFGLISSP
jgi:septal ring factor EnvC (AmiA/AmiB activator)